MTKQKISDKDQLQLFVTRTIELNNTRLMRDRQLHNYKPSFNWNTEDGFSFKVEDLDEDDLRSFLLTFRHFIADKEPVFFHSVTNTCSKRIKTSEYPNEFEQLKKAKKEWVDRLKGDGDIKIIIDREKLEPETVLDLYINGKYFHNDQSFATQLNKWAENPIPLDKMRFIMTLQDLTHIINWTAQFIAYGLNNDWFDFPASQST